MNYVVFKKVFIFFPLVTIVNSLTPTDCDKTKLENNSIPSMRLSIHIDTMSPNNTGCCQNYRFFILGISVFFSSRRTICHKPFSRLMNYLKLTDIIYSYKI